MNLNTQYIAEAKSKIERYEKDREPEHLRQAALALQNVDLKAETEWLLKAQTRLTCLTYWVTILQLLDYNLEPDFDPNEIIPMNVIPPHDNSIERLPSGADPKLIKDPKARADYEQKIEANRLKQQIFRAQTQLHRLKDYLPACAKRFIAANYTSIEIDRLELNAAIEKHIKIAERKAELLKLIEP